MAFLFHDSAAAATDTISLLASEAPASGMCTFENEPFRDFLITSTSPCTNVTVTGTFALHFRPAIGIPTSLAHMSLTRATTVHGPRVLGL